MLRTVDHGKFFDFTKKPGWWDGRYGASPYTSGNLVLWDDVAKGFIADGTRKGYYAKYAKPDVTNILPIDENGNLLSPLSAGILNASYIVDASHQKNWQYGDHAPAETAWRRSSSYKFAEQSAKFLAKPGKYAGLWFDTQRATKNIAGQYVYNNLYRQDITQYILPTTTTQTSGWINTVSDYVKHLGYDANNYISQRFTMCLCNCLINLEVSPTKTTYKLLWAVCHLRALHKACFLPQENFDILLYKSAPVVTASYSGVIVQKTSSGYKVSGYSNFARTFKYYQPKPSVSSSTIRIGATTESFTEWQAGGFYNKGSIVRNAGIFYRALAQTSSGQSFNAINWAEIGAVLPLQGGVSVQKI